MRYFLGYADVQELRRLSGPRPQVLGALERLETFRGSRADMLAAIEVYAVKGRRDDVRRLTALLLIEDGRR